MKSLSALLLSAPCWGPSGPGRREAHPPFPPPPPFWWTPEAAGSSMRRDAHTPRLIASTTKLLTALVAAESVTVLQRTVTVQRVDTLTEGSSMYLKVGEEVTVEALLYGLLLQSGNDAALALARICAGDVDAFVARG